MISGGYNTQVGQSVNGGWSLSNHVDSAETLANGNAYKARRIFASQLPVVPLHSHPTIAALCTDLTRFWTDGPATSAGFGIETLTTVD